MSPSRRLIAAAIGVALPLLAAATAQAAPHRPAHVRSATYKVVQQHKPTRHHHAKATPRQVAQAHRHSIMRGS